MPNAGLTGEAVGHHPRRPRPVNQVSGFERDEGCVVVGGCAYRPQAVPTLGGVYFYAHVTTGEQADVRTTYRAAFLHSLFQGPAPQLAIDKLLITTSPTEIAQQIIYDAARLV